MKKRIQVTDGEIRIKSPKSTFLLLTLPVSLIIWAIGLVTAIRALRLHSGDDPFVQPFLSVWITLWCLGGLFFIYVLFWLLFGHEVVTRQDGFLVIKHSIFGFGLTKRFPLSEILNLRPSPFVPRMAGPGLVMIRYGLSGGTVAFDYNGKTQRLGIELSERESHELVDMMNQQFNLG